MTRRPRPAADPGSPEPNLALIVDQLLRRLERPGEPSAETLTRARDLFADAADPLRVRWLECELRGYGHSGAVSVYEALGMSSDVGASTNPDQAPLHALLARVRGYRQYIGRVRSAATSRPGRALQVPYFFGESIATVHHLRANTDAIGLEFLEIEVITSGRAGLASLPSGAPTRTLEFPRSVFYRILAGLTVELELALQTLLANPT